MLIGYARTSTIDQEAGYQAQLRELQSAGAEKIFSEKISAVARDRPELERAIDFAREGDCLVVTKPDRLARSVAHLCTLLARLEAKSVTLKILSMNVDTTTPTGRLMLTMLGAVAQFEREIMLERQREGTAKARAAGKYKGRAPTARRHADEIIADLNAGTQPKLVAEKYNIGVASVHRVRRERKAGLV